VTVFVTMGSWMHTRHPVGAPEWKVDDTVAILQRSRPGIAFADLTACNDYPGASGPAATVSVPMLLILGDQDLMTKPSAAEPIKGAASDARTVIVEGAGHMAMVERPHVVNEALMEFLNRVESRK
jgi:pimeloyl-ACP methyl ester carboxylesterase